MTYSIKNFFLLAAVIVVTAPAMSLAAITTQLDVGDTGSEVSELQTFLASDSSIYPEALVTGYFGTLTQRAVERYQCAKGIVCSGTPTTTGYGRVGPTTSTRINLELSGGSVSGGGVSTGDVSAPIVYPETVTVGDTSAAIAWTSSEPSYGRVMYGSSWPFLYASAPSVASGTFSVSNTVTLSGLGTNTTYYYTRESRDASGNVQWSIPKTFKTN